MGTTKTTLLLGDELRGELKRLALRRGTTLTALLTEGAQLVIDKGRGEADAAELRRRAHQLRTSFRRGLYAGPAVSDLVDDLVYPSSRRPARGARSR